MRRIAYTSRWFLAASATVAVVWSGGMGAALAARHDWGSLAPAAPPAPLVEVPECWGPPTPASAVPDTAGATVQTLTVTVERTALVRIDAAGRVLAAETNTGCAPRPGDHVLLVGTDGSLREATGFDVAAITWTGDFTRFGFVPQG